MIFLAGQTVYKHDVEGFRKYFPPPCILVNRLGLTEFGRVTQFVMDHQSQIDSNTVPVGYVVEGAEILIRDKNGNITGADRVGEIAIKSQYLSPGYWRQPDLTRQKFLDDPQGGDKRIYLTGDLGRMRPDGCLEHLGREDFQVKIRGYRVDLLEIETALHALAAVKEAVVVTRDNQTGDMHLVAYLVPTSHPASKISELRRALAEKLPDYMIPSRFVLLDALPLTPTGKVNRETLPAPDLSRPELSTLFVAPRNDLECQLALSYEKVLGVHPVGVKDDFFDLGGNSLSFIRLLTEIEHLLGYALPMNALFHTPTIEHIAKMLRRHEKTSLSADPVDHSKAPERYNPLRLIFRLIRLPHLSWSKKISRSIRVIRGVFFKKGPTFGNIVLPYPLGARFLTWFCASGLIQASLLRQEVRSFKTFLTAMSRSPHDAELIQNHLAANLWQHWRVHALACCTPLQFQNWVTVRGLSTLQQAYEQRRGVIVLNSHFVLLQITHLVLTHQGFLDYQTVGTPILQAETAQFRQLRHSSGQRAGRSGFLHLLRQFHEAQKKLKAGGLMLIGGDGGSGHNGVFLSFYGRRLYFRSGFAEAAASTGAEVLPAFVSLKPTGHIHVEFLDPLDPGMPEMSHEQRVAWLIQQYATLLEQRWTQDPANLESRIIKRFLTSLSING